jgi:predicted PurR-regulated permease PerM
MIILLPLTAALIVSYIIWQFNTRILRKNIALSKVATYVVIVTIMIYVVFSGLSLIVEGF